MQMRDDDAVRIDKNAYLAARSAQLTTISNSTRSRLGFDVTTGGDSAGDAEVIARLLFERLPTAIAKLRDNHSLPVDASPLFLFNEHYVVKPPTSEVEFRWHRDDDEQLGMCVHRNEVAPYVSAWCALDAVTLDNGPLRFLPLDDPANGLADASRDSSDPACLDSDEAKAAAFDANATAPMAAAAGDVVFFLSNVWHASSANETSAARRAFYAQFSTERITAGPNDPAPLSFAIPCTAIDVDDPGRSSKRQRS
jgi:ectoine hydroxylase-related dioxygenase (phytanoyl-CoA dioxygenase family)